MPSIEISRRVYDYLAEQAEPFVDTPNTVLERLLGLSTEAAEARPPSAASPPYRPSRRAARKRRARGQAKASNTRQIDFMPTILAVLVEIGGAGRSEDVTRKVWANHESSARAGDFDILSSGDVRWHRMIHWARLRLRVRGLGTGDRGRWEITESGRRAVDQGLSADALERLPRTTSVRGNEAAAESTSKRPRRVRR